MSLLLVGGCSAQASHEADNNASADTVAGAAMNGSNSADSAVPEATLPTHRYAFRDGDVYGYVSEVSEEMKKKGVATGETFLFKFLGNYGGEYRIVMVDDGGDTLQEYRCDDPCSFVKVGTGSQYRREFYSGDSIVGSALADALDGQLAVARRKAPAAVALPRSETPNPATVDYPDATPADTPGTNGADSGGDPD